MIKKSLVIFFIMLALPCFADNKDVFTPKEYVITVPQILQDEDSYEEKELTLEWNQWHADVRNELKKPVTTPMYKKSFVDYVFYVDNKGNLSDIFVIMCTSLALDTPIPQIKKDGIFYGYSYDENQFYKFKAPKSFLCSKTWSSISALASSMTVTPVDSKYVPYKDVLQQMASGIKSSEGNSFYKYPTGSKRTKMKVSCGWKWYLWEGGNSYFNASDFNDVEKIKYQEKK